MFFVKHANVAQTDAQTQITVEQVASEPVKPVIEEGVKKTRIGQDEVIKQIQKIAEDNDFPPELLISLARCESGFDPYAIGDNGNSYGLWQIYLKYHPDVSKEQAQDINFSTVWTINKFKAGGWRLWTCARNLGLTY